MDKKTGLLTGCGCHYGNRSGYGWGTRVLTFVSKASIKYSDSSSLTGRQVRCKNRDGLLHHVTLCERSVSNCFPAGHVWMATFKTRQGKSKRVRNPHEQHLGGVWFPGDSVSQPPSNVNKDALCRTLQVSTQDKRLVYLILCLFILIYIDFPSKCVFSDLVCTDSARLQEEVLWQTLAQSEAWIPVSWPGLISMAQSRGPVHGQVTVQTDSRHFRSRWKQKLMRPSVVPCQLSLCAQVWEELHRSRNYFVTSVYACVCEREWDIKQDYC